MLLKLQKSEPPMKIVYLLSKKLEMNPKHMELAQALTLDESRPNMGLNGTHGLFGSLKWWENIQQGVMPLRFVSGIIKRAYVAGQDSSKFNNTITIALDDGSIKDVGIYVNNEKDATLFKSGYLASIVYALDELKPGAMQSFGRKYHEVALEMAVSLEPASIK